MAEQGKGAGGKGNSQIPTTYSGKNAPIKKMGTESGSGKYGSNPPKKKSK